ncbi:YLPM1 [Mytilus edulis]|uniref:YLP motif-containing protein 1 n=1 Tax=Mytilus edulis TaxID=6550 RepID=A0A8S3UP90_MYTED|nr:YLPM1 [Mytilus edulis]
MPLKGGPISLMDIRFDKPPAPKVTIDENEQKSDEQDKGEENKANQTKKEKEITEPVGPIQKEFALGQSEKNATSGLGTGKGIPGLGDGKDALVVEKTQEKKEDKEKSPTDDKSTENKKSVEEKQNSDQMLDIQNQGPTSLMGQGLRPQGPGMNQPFGPNQGQGPRPFGPNQGQGPRQFGPNQGQGPRGFAPNQGQGLGPRGFAPNQGQGLGPRGGFAPNQGQGLGPRGFAPNQGQGLGPRGFAPNQGQGPRGFAPNQQEANEFDEDPEQIDQMQGMPGARGQIPGQRGARGQVPGQRGARGQAPGQRGARGQVPGQFGPRGFNQNQGPRGFGVQNQMGQGLGQFEEENSEQYGEQNFGHSDEPLEFMGKFNQNKADRGIRGRGRGPMNRGQMIRGRGRGRGWQHNQFQEEPMNQQQPPQPEPEPEVYNEEEEKERLRRELEEEGEQWMATHQQQQEEIKEIEKRREQWGERRTPPLHGDRFDRPPFDERPPFDDPYRRDPYFDRVDPYFDRRDPYYPDRRPYEYDPYSARPHDYYYPDRYGAPPREPSPRLFVAPEVIDHGHKSSGLADYPTDREPIEYKPPQVIDYGHGKSSDDAAPSSDMSHGFNPDSRQSYDRESDFSRDSQYYERDSRGRDNNRESSRDGYGDYSSSSSSRDRDRDRDKNRDRDRGDRDRDRDRDRDSRSSKSVHEPKVETGQEKTYVGKLIKDKEVQHGGGAPRMLCLDDYFMTEVEKTEKDPETGKKVKKKVLEYEFEAELESSYRKNMYKSFKKTIDDGFFPFIIVDAVNEKERHFEEFWSYAKSKGFQVYIAEIQADVATCVKRNTHNRSQSEIEKIEKGWQETPKHYLRLDVRSILQEVSIQEVEMETEEDEKPEPKPDKRKKVESDEEEDVKFGEIKKSKWEVEPSGTQLDKLDGLIHHNKKIAPVHQSMEDFLQLPDDYDTRPLAPGQKRVRWADIEEKKIQSRRRDIGFVVGQTQRDWERITDDSYADRQLNRTKYF